MDVGLAVLAYLSQHVITRSQFRVCRDVIFVELFASDNQR